MCNNMLSNTSSMSCPYPSCNFDLCMSCFYRTKVSPYPGRSEQGYYPPQHNPYPGGYGYPKYGY